MVTYIPKIKKIYYNNTRGVKMNKKAQKIIVWIMLIAMVASAVAAIIAYI